jgi:hypothetical protein
MLSYPGSVAPRKMRSADLMQGAYEGGVVASREQCFGLDRA